MQQNKFNFFVPCDRLQKGKDNKGQDVVIIDGIASTSSVADSDDETLYPVGFNLRPFLETGLINFNHQGSKDSNANIGVPLEAKIINNGQDLYVKCMLWPCPQTDGIVRAYENFKKYNIDRKIGFSIEGQAILRGNPDQRHPDYKKILKADISGLAVTFSAKNKNTLMNIVKGNYTEAYQPLNSEAANNLPQGVDGATKNVLRKADVCIAINRRYPSLSVAEKMNILALIYKNSSKIVQMSPVVSPK